MELGTISVTDNFANTLLVTTGKIYLKLAYFTSFSMCLNKPYSSTNSGDTSITEIAFVEKGDSRDGLTKAHP